MTIASPPKICGRCLQIEGSMYRASKMIDELINQEAKIQKMVELNKKYYDALYSLANHGYPATKGDRGELVKIFDEFVDMARATIDYMEYHPDKDRDDGACCDNEQRSMDGGCLNCGDPSF